MPEFVGGNRITLLRNGEEYFPALVAAFDAAGAEIYLETYIFADDETGSLIADALARAAARGVSTHLMLDGFGARDFPQRLRTLLATAGVELLVFRPQVSPWPFWKQRSRLRRMHRKLASIDGQVGFVGGINIIDDWFENTDVREPARYDYAVRIEGTLCASIRAEAVKLWTRVSWASTVARWRSWPRVAVLSRRAVPTPAGPVPAAAGTQRAALVVRDSLWHRQDIEQAYIAHIEASRQEVILACAYFLPGRRFRHVLLRAARRGVDVILLMQGKTDHPLLYYASRALYRSFLGAGIRIHEYHRSELHAKVAVVDRRIATVGSSNIDPFSFGLAREANVFVDDVRFAAELRADLHRTLEGRSTPVPANYWRRLNGWLKLRIWLAYRVARLVLSIYRFESLR